MCSCSLACMCFLWRSVQSFCVAVMSHQLRASHYINYVCVVSSNVGLISTGGLMVNTESQGSSPTSVRVFSVSPCLTSMPWSSLSSTPSIEEVFHHILRRRCKAVGPGGPGSISLWLFQALVGYYYSGKPKRVIYKKKALTGLRSVTDV